MRIPLGGDGITSPIAAWEISGFSVTGDASGGAASLRVNLDPRNTALVAFVTNTIVQVSSADADINTALLGNAGSVPTQALSGPVSAISATVSTGTIRQTWRPEPYVMPGGNGAGAHIRTLFLNVTNDVYFMSALIYIFNIRARELMPMSYLLAGRGSN